MSGSSKKPAGTAFGSLLALLAVAEVDEEEDEEDEVEEDCGLAVLLGGGADVDEEAETEEDDEEESKKSLGNAGLVDLWTTWQKWD